MKELRTGVKEAPATAETAHRALAARGPTDLKGIDGEGAKETHPVLTNGNDHVDTAVEAAQLSLRSNAAEVFKRFKIHLLSGDFAKQLTGRKKYTSFFSSAEIGRAHV
eukprot:TRINITY_DN14469_c0_g1_i2.p2 TRINITY_DN14469_c0_g1~~TRINITY_DN14469_c0_g1_i2.p2  ORF type:complete len:108 (+),score=18.85 TRINITY_DN14469_c0_g1_i2:214-537(+)